MKSVSALFFTLLAIGALQGATNAAPGYFEPNRGQSPASAPFLARVKSGLAAVEPTRLRLKSGAGTGIEVELAGASPQAEGQGLQSAPGVSHYALLPDPSKWIYGVPHFGEVQFHRVYPGIDLRYHLAGNDIEFDFEVAANSDPRQIRLSFAGNIRTSDEGDLQLTGGTIRKPSAWQTIGGERHYIDAAYRTAGPGLATFSLGPHDASLPVTIDPVVTLTTYLGGASSELDTQTVVDPAGNIYMAGATLSTDFPAKELPGSRFNVPVYLRDTDLYVTRLKPDASAIDWSFFIGGTAMERCTGLLQDVAGNIYVFGTTSSGNFPVTSGAWKTTINSTLADSFVVKLDAQTGLIRASTYLGLTSNGGASVDPAGGVYAAGTTPPEFQPSAGAYQTKSGSVGIVRLNSSLTSAVYATYMDIGRISLLQADANGNLIFAGAGGPPPAINAIPGIDQTYGFGFQAFIAKLNPSGTTLVYSSELNGNGRDSGITDLKVDASGNAWVAGYTNGSALPQVNPVNLPIPPADFSTAYGISAFFAEVPPQGKALLRSTLFYGPGFTDSFNDVFTPFIKLVFPAGRLCIVGAGVASSYPSGIVSQSVGALGGDGAPKFSNLNCLDDSGTNLGVQTLLPDIDGSYTSVQATPDGSVLFAGMTDGGLTTTPGVVQPLFGGQLFRDSQYALNGGDAFLMKVSLANPSPRITSVSPNSVFPLASLGFNQSATTFTLTGTGFAYGTQITWNGTNIVSTFNSPTKITLTNVPAATIQPGANLIGASLPGPGGGVSPTVTVNGWSLSPDPVTLTPSSVPAGSPETKLIISATGLTPASVLTWNGSPRAATFVPAQPPQTGGYFQLLLEPDELAQSSVSTITVTNPAPGGGTSLPVRFSVTAVSGAAVPTLTSPVYYAFDEVTPPPATVTLSGSGFTAASAVYWDGSLLASSFVSATQLKVTPPAGTLSTLGVHDIYVTNGILRSTTLRFYVARLLNQFNGVTSVYDPVRDIAYSLSQSASGNTLDLAGYSGSTGAKSLNLPAVIGNYTAGMTLSDDGRYLYLYKGVTGLEVKRIDTAKGAADLDFQAALPATVPNDAIVSIATIAGSPQSIAVLTGNVIEIYDNDRLRALQAKTGIGYTPLTLFATGNRIFRTDTAYPCLSWWDFDSFGIEDSSSECNGSVPELSTANGFAWLTDGNRTVTVGSPYGVGNPSQNPWNWIIDPVRRLAYATPNTSLQILQVNLDTLQQTTGPRTSIGTVVGGGLFLATDGSLRAAFNNLLLKP